MKKLIAVGLALATLSVFADKAGGDKSGKKPLTDAEKAERRARFYQRTGGFVRRPGTGSGRVVFVNAQKRFGEASLASLAREVSGWFSMDVAVCAAANVGFTNAAETVRAQKAAAGVVAADLGSQVPPLVIVPDGRYALVNVAELPENADEKLFQKELLRGFAGAAGALSSQQPVTLMGSFDNFAKLAAYPNVALPNDVVMRVRNALKLGGVVPYQMTTYVNACREGWAHAPTNDVEKAIWEARASEKERGPVNAIKIAPPKK